jgi:cytochrome c5
MKKKAILTLLVALPLIFAACSGGKSESATSDETKTEASEESSEDLGSYDPHRGEGKFDSTNVKISGLDAAMAAKGEKIAETKCFSCHKITDEKLVGPGWKGVTHRKAPYWIMNFITNPDAMIDQDPEVQAQLEICLVRMPNQNLNDEEAREIVEFMRKNDGVK